MKTRFQLRREKKREKLILWSLRSLIGTMSGLTPPMFILKVPVGVTMVTMVMALHGNMWMKLLVHKAHCEATIFQGMPATSVQEMDSQGWLNLKKT